MKLIAAALGIFLIPFVTLAHHSGADLDRTALKELVGEVTRVAWVNPHILISLRSEGVEWKLGGQAQIGLTRLGVPRDVVQVGQQITVAGYAAQDEPYMGLRNILLVDGSELLLTRDARPRWSPSRTIGFGTGDPSGADVGAVVTQSSGLFRVWPRTIEVQTVTWSAPFSLTEYAQAVKSSWTPEQDTTLRCAAPGMPRAMTQNPWAIQFVDHGDTIELRLEEFDQIRTIYMNESAITDNPQRTRLGYSTGRWEDDTILVVRTVATDYPFFDREGVPLSERAEIVERFALSEDQARLNYEITVTDPQTFMEPVIGAKYWDWKPGIELLPYEGVRE